MRGQTHIQRSRRQSRRVARTCQIIGTDVGSPDATFVGYPAPRNDSPDSAVALAYGAASATRFFMHCVTCDANADAAKARARARAARPTSRAKLASPR